MSKLTDIRRAAMNLLARREHSEKELFRKLSKKDFLEADLRLVIDQLAQEGLLSNTRFMENYIHYRSSKGYGPIRIRAELMERGIAEDSIDTHLNITDNAWFSHVRKVWGKRFKNYKPQAMREKAQQIRFLLYRGFTQEQIESIFQSDD